MNDIGPLLLAILMLIFYGIGTYFKPNINNKKDDNNE